MNKVFLIGKGSNLSSFLSSKFINCNIYIFTRNFASSKILRVKWAKRST